MQKSVPHKWKDIDEKILVELSNGRNVPSNLADELDVSRQWITQRLQQMESADFVRNTGRGVYEIQPGNIPDEKLEELNITIEDVSDLVEELETVRAERDDLRERVDSQERLQERVDELRRELEAARTGDSDVPLEDLKNARVFLDRALTELPEDVPGRSAAQDAQRILEEVLDDER